MAFLASLYSIRWVVLSALLGLYILHKFRQCQRLSDFKGPFSTGWCELWHSSVILRRRSHLEYRAVNDKYGPVARIGPNDLMTSSPELLAYMSGVRSSYERSPWVYGTFRFETGKDHCFSQLDEEKHKKRRAQLASGLSGKQNLTLEADIDERIQALFSLLRRKYLTTKDKTIPVDMGRKVQYFTLDVISAIGFGKTFGNLEADADADGYIAATEEGMAGMAVILALGLRSIIQWPPIERLIGPKPSDKSGLGHMLGQASKLIDARMEKSTEGRSDMLTSFINNGLSKAELVTESVLQIQAGSDTTATAIRCTLLYLSSHPRVYKKLQAEIDETVASGQAPPAPGVVEESVVRELPYLNAVIREVLRIHPPVPNILAKKVPESGDSCVIEGKQYYFPGGTNISYNVWSLHHRKDIFGEDANHFRPERWMIEGEKLTEMRRTTELIFGSGKYQCLGKSIAWMEMNKLIFELLRHFDWAIAEPEKPWESTNYNGVFGQKDMWMQVTERE